MKRTINDVWETEVPLYFYFSFAYYLFRLKRWTQALHPVQALQVQAPRHQVRALRQVPAQQAPTKSQGSPFRWGSH